MVNETNSGYPRLPHEFRELEQHEKSFASSLKDEILGLRQEMLQYMQQQFLVENFSLTAAAISFTYMLSINSGAKQFSNSSNLTNDVGENIISETISSAYYTGGDVVKTLFLAAITLLILWLGRERVKMLRYRISRLGLYIYLRERCFPDRGGWEHFVHSFRELDFRAVTHDFSRAWVEPDSAIRAEKLNSIIQNIDSTPGSYTKNLYKRWWVIIAITSGGCIAQILFVLYKYPGTQDVISGIYRYFST